MRRVIVLTRFRVPAADAPAFLAEARDAVRVLSERVGCRTVQLGRAVDAPDLWVLHSSWESVGAYRRALSSYEVKVHAVPLLSRCLDEPTAFELRLDGAEGQVAELPGALPEDP